MAWNSTLKRKTPLKAKSGFKAPFGFRKKDMSQQPVSETGKPRCTKGHGKQKKDDRSSLVTHLDIVFSLYIRLRDAMEGGRCKCISCGAMFPFEQIQAGQYFSRRLMSTRWDEQNVNGECWRCNCHDPSHLDGYKARLLIKIGEESYDALCARAHEARKWSGDELRDLIKHYTAEARRLAKEKGINVRL